MINTIYDEQFGSLTWEPQCCWWSGTIKLYDSRDIEINVNTPDDNDRVITQSVREAFKLIAESEKKIRQKACDDLLKTHNQSWNDKEPIDAETFMKRIILESVVLYPDGDAEIYFADDDLFWGHVIIVSMSEAGKFTDATIAG